MPVDVSETEPDRRTDYPEAALRHDDEFADSVDSAMVEGFYRSKQTPRQHTEAKIGKEPEQVEWPDAAMIVRHVSPPWVRR